MLQVQRTTARSRFADGHTRYSMTAPPYEQCGTERAFAEPVED